MRAGFASIAVTIALLASGPSALAASACGPMDAAFEVRRSGSPYVAVQPESGKALVYVVQEDCRLLGCPTTRVAADGAWAGANRNKSYFSFAVNPGVHHLCAAIQPGSSINPRSVGLLHFMAEAGETYYVRIRILFNTAGKTLAVDLESIDSDQGSLLTRMYPLSVSHQKK